MLTDVAELRGFYTGELGRMTKRHLRGLVQKLWPDLRSCSVLALGYGTPLLRPILAEAKKTIAFMPAQQGVIHWPQKENTRNLTALVDPQYLPVPDTSIDRVILVHLLETTPVPDIILDEVWRILAANGRLLAIVPNRSGLWALSDSTPFGHGTAYSSRQLRGMMRRHHFIPENEHHALFAPPSSASFWLKTSPIWEKSGQRWLRALAGVRAIEASKQLYIPSKAPVTSGRRILQISRPVPAGLRVS